MSLTRPERIQKLVDRVGGLPAICVERGIAFTESYKETEGEPPVIRQAKALAHYLDTMTLSIPDEELLVGNPTSKPRAGALLPELNIAWLKDELDNMSVRDWDRFVAPTPEERKAIFDMMPYWEGRSTADQWKKYVPPETMALEGCGFFGGSAFAVNTFYPAHMSIDWGRMLKEGLSGIRLMAEEKQKSITPPKFDELESYHLYEAIKIIIDGVYRYAERYAELAEELAGKTADPVRKCELLEMAEAVRRAPRNRPRSFREAMQAVALVWVVLEIENWGHGVTIGRPDQYLYEFYKEDKKKGAIADEEILILIEMLYIKLNSTVSLDDFRTATVFAGFPQICNVVLGGQKRDGSDAVNELSFLFLEAERYTRLPMEDLVCRINKNTPRDFVYKAVEVAKELNGKIKFVGDDVHLGQLMHDGYGLEESRDFVVTGCNSPSIQGVSLDVPGGIFNMPFMLELALNNGVARLTGEKVGLETGDPREFTAYEEIWEAFSKQLEYFIEAAITLTNTDRMLSARYTPTPFQSALFNGPIESGIEILNGGTGKYARHAISMAGAPNVGDAFAALKKCVFEDRSLTIGRVIDALDANFEGYDDVRYMLASAPKFGNDEDYVDKIVDETLALASKYVTRRNNYAGNPMNMAAAAITANVPHGYMLGATPDGRLAGTPISEGGISPQQGRNVNGPIPTLRSVSKLDHNNYTNGCVLNMRFNPASLKNEDGKNKFVDMLYAYFNSGGPFVQFNIIDKNTLLDAQKNPDKYQDLLVRIATYTAYFVELSPDMQSDIISRIEMEN